MRPWPAGGLVARLDPSVPRPRARLSLVGELDLATAPDLLRELDGLALDGSLHVELDLAGVPFCDVVGLRALQQGRARLRARGGSLTVRRPCRSLLTLQAILRLDESLEPRPPRTRSELSTQSPAQPSVN